MKTTPIVPGRPVLGADGTLRSAAYDDMYHPLAGAAAQARDVFLAGNALPTRWQGRERFVILETGFGLGNNFLATWAAHRADHARCRRLHFISIEAHPLAAADLVALPRDPGLGELAAELAAAWPPLTCNLHRLAFDGGAVQLLLAFGDVAAWLPQIEATVDAIYLDGFAPARNPAMWEPRVMRALARMAAPGATAATWSAARIVRDGLRDAGFEVQAASGSGGKRDITLARFAARPSTRLAPRRRQRVDDASCIVVVGAGLAGCAVAWALADQGRQCTVIERRAGVACEASGNAAGIFHGVVHRGDGRHARFHRAAALEATRAVGVAIDRHGVAGSRDGLLRLATTGVSESALEAIADRLGLPHDYVEVLSPAEASLRAGVPIAVPAWWFPGGGWVDPRGLARSYLERAGSSVTLRLGIEVAALRRVGDAWQLVDDFGAIIATAEVVVLANAGGASGLLAHADWPIARVRGQVSALAIDAVAASAWPKVPVAGAGYALPPVDGRLWFGATSQVDDADTSVRDSDHADNLARLATWLGGIPVGVRPVAGRTGWREVSEDRLPVIGAVAAASAAGLSSGAAAAGAGRFDQPRFIARAEGLFACTALGSRGIAFSALGAQVLASAVTGAPCPLDADLIDAVDPARFISRAWRRAAVQPGRDTGDQPPPGLTAGAPTGA